MRASKNITILEWALGVILLLCTVFREFKLTLYISAVSVIIYTLIVIFLFKDRLFFKYMWYFIASVFLMVGVFACDAVNIWLSEIEAITYYCGSFNIIALYYWIYYWILRKIDPYFEKHTRRIYTNVKIGEESLSRIVIKYGRIILFVFGLGLFLSVAAHPFFIYGVTNRFEYAQTYISRWQNLLRVFPPMLAPLVLIPFLRDKHLEINGFIKNLIIPYIPYLLFLIWTGNKYGAYIELIVFILVPLIVSDRIKVKSKYVLKYGIMLCLAILAFLFLYYHLQGLSLLEAGYQVYLRVACQGELWWKTIATVDNNGPNISEFANEIMFQGEAIITEASVKKYGVYHLMNLLGRATIVEQYGTIGTRFAASGMELPFYCFGFWALLLPILICPITAWINNMYLNAVKERRVFTAIVSARVIMLLIPALSQGDWYAFFSLVPFLFVLMLFFIELWNHISKSNKRRYMN